MFKYQFFTIPVMDSGAAQEALNTFLLSHKIQHVEKQFVADAQQSFWSVCVQYADHGSHKGNTENRKPRIDYKEVLSEQEFALFAALRDLRKQIAEVEGVPVFAIWFAARQGFHGSKIMGSEHLK